MKQLFKTSVLTLSVLAVSGLADVMPNVQVASVFAAEQKPQKKARRTPALGSRVYSQLARAQEIADQGDVEAGLEVLDQVKAKASSLNAYEVAMMYNFYGFIYYNNERIPEAIQAFEMVVKQQPIPESLEQSTLFSLAQLAMADEQYDKTIDYLNRWEQVIETKVPIKNHVLKAQAMYQAKRFEQAAAYIEKAMSQSKTENINAEESWYVLQRAVYFELKQAEKVTAVLEQMVRLFNKPEYWTQLAGMYGELGQEDKQMAVLEAAYQQGFVSKKSDFRSLSQMYYFNGMPYKAAVVLETAMKDDIVEADQKNLTFLAQSWLGAKEYAKAITSYQQLAVVTSNGDAEQNIAEIYLQQGKFTKAMNFANKAIAKGQLTTPGNAYLTLGMATFNLKRYDQSKQAFVEAGKIDKVSRMANQWLKFVEREQKNAEQLALN